MVELSEILENNIKLSESFVINNPVDIQLALENCSYIETLKKRVADLECELMQRKIVMEKTIKSTDVE